MNDILESLHTKRHLERLLVGMSRHVNEGKPLPEEAQELLRGAMVGHPPAGNPCPGPALPQGGGGGCIPRCPSTRNHNRGLRAPDPHPETSHRTPG